MSNLKSSTKPMMTKRLYAKKDPQARIQERRERLLNAALQLFATQGYAHTTIEALCSEAKVTTRNFYQAFSGREELLLALFNQIMTELDQALLHAIHADSHQPPTEKMTLMIQALVTHYLADRRYAQVGVLEVVGASPVIEQRRREVIHTLAAHLEVFFQHLAQQQQLTARNYHWLAIAMVGGINELIAEWLVNPQLSLAQLCAEILLMAQALLQGVTSGSHPTREL